MTSINAGGAFYRVQNELANNSDRLSQSMLRLASGKQNIAPGDRTSSTAVAFAMKAESASLKVGMMNGTEALQSIEMVTNDLAQLNDIVVRMEEIHALGSNAFVTPEDRAALTAEANNLLTEMTRISGDAKWKGNAIIKTSATDTTTNTMSFGRNAATVDIVLDEFKIPELALGFNTVGDSIYGDIDISVGASATGTAYATLTTPAQAVAAQTVVDTKPNDKLAQAALAVGGAVYYEHLTKAGQDKFNTTGTADPNGITTSAAFEAADDDKFSTTASVTLGNSLVMTGTLTNAVGRQVLITGAASETGNTFTITGTDVNGDAITEDLTGGAATATSVKFYKTITSIKPSIATAGAVEAGTVAAGAADLAIGGALASNNTVTNNDGRNVTITSGADDSSANFTVTGTDRNGNALVEIIAGENAGVATGAQFFKTITSIKSSAVPAGTIETGVGATVGGPGPVTMVGSDIASGSAVAAASLLSLKTVVDNMNIAAGTLYNKVSNTMSHMGSLNAGYQLDLASKMDVDFAGETAELAKGQILAQAGTAMLAQANAQRQGMLALLQS